MAKVINYACPDCAGTFRWLRHPSTEPPPNFCPLCGSCVNPDAVFVPAAPHVGRSIGKTADQVYRQMETAGESRQQLAAELGGGDTKDYAALKVTDLSDYLRPGDTAAKMVNNPVSQVMEAHRVGGFQSLEAGSEFAGATAKGAFPRRGEAARRDLVTGHADRQRVMEGAGLRARSK